MQLTQGEFNQINVKSTLEITQPSLIKKTQQLCRICLEQLEVSEIPDLCLCKGENSLVHEKCQLEWMKRTDKYEQFPYTYFYLCDICKSRIYLDTQIIWSCKKWEDIHFCGQSTFCTIITSIAFLIGLTLIIEGTFLLKNSDIKPLVIFGIAAGAIVVIICFIGYLFQVILHMELVIYGIKKKKSKPSKKNQIMPSVPQDYLVPQFSIGQGPLQNQGSFQNLGDFQH